MSDGTINTQLNTGNVVVQTSTGDILIDATGVAIAPTLGANARTLTLNAYGSIGWSGNWSYTNNGVLTLRANNGTIYNDAGKLTAGSVILSAFDGMGCNECNGNQFLQTQVTNLQATNTNNGIEIKNTGNLTLTSLGAGFAVQNTNGAVRIDSTGNMTVNNTVTAGRLLPCAPTEIW